MLLVEQENHLHLNVHEKKKPFLCSIPVVSPMKSVSATYVIGVFPCAFVVYLQADHAQRTHVSGVRVCLCVHARVRDIFFFFYAIRCSDELFTWRRPEKK